MAKAVLLVQTNPLDPESEAEFNAWYDGIHVPDVLKVPGFVAATRYRVAAAQMPGRAVPPHRYLAVYEVDGDDLEKSLQALSEAAGEMFISPTLDQSEPPPAVLYEQIGPRLVSGA